MLRQGVVARDLDGAVPRVLVRTETTKSRRADTLAIHPQLAGSSMAVGRSAMPTSTRFGAR